MKFENAVFIVTGGASGLGEATVRSIHGAGAKVVIADLNTERGEKLAAELGSRTAFQRTDVAAMHAIHLIQRPRHAGVTQLNVVQRRGSAGARPRAVTRSR